MQKIQVMTYRLILLSAILFPYLASAQNNYTGFATDNYNGYTGSYFQPASIVNSVNKVSVVSSFNFLAGNNYSGNNASVISTLFGNENSRYRDHFNNGYQFRNTSFDVLGAHYEINHENAVGYSFRIRSFGNVDGLDNAWTEAIFNGYDDTKPLNTPITMRNYNYVQFVYNEHRFNYARVIQDEGDRFIKAGVAMKLINGIDATYLHARDGEFQFDQPFGTNGDITVTEFSYGQAEKENMFTTRKLGFGLDLGVVYEYRPFFREYRYYMDGKANIERYDKNKYLFKVGASITDIGGVRFSRDTTTYDFTTVSTDQNMADLGELSFVAITGGGINVLQSFDSLAANSVENDNQKEKFLMNLPTTLNLQFDYNLWNNIYIGYASSTSLKRKADPHKVHSKSIHSIIPRYESAKIGVSVPLTIQRNAQFNVGLSARYTFAEGAFSFFGGSNNITNLFGKRAKFNRNTFLGFSYQIPYTIPSDIDGDKVSDLIDDCIYDPGPLKMNGCPDTDFDGIPDKEDYCIYSPGPLEHNGCPDTDGDGVIDLNDQCPEEPGLAVHYGCPDRDKDGVIDVADRCPDVPGIEFNNGCPFENPGCCTDNDGDGITNSLDKCPEVAGSIYNDGCPIDSTNLEKIDFQESKKEVDPNHTEEKIEIIKEDEPENEMQDGTQVTEDTFVTGDKVESLNVYFNKDDATLSNSYNEQIIALAKRYDFSDGSKYHIVIVGHTDNDGSENYNLILSKKRAETVRRKLESNGADYDQIEVYYYGEWKPLKTNNNEEQKRFNRRVEIMVIKK